MNINKATKLFKEKLLYELERANYMYKIQPVKEANEIMGDEWVEFCYRVWHDDLSVPWDKANRKIDEWVANPIQLKTIYKMYKWIIKTIKENAIYYEHNGQTWTKFENLI